MNKEFTVKADKLIMFSHSSVAGEIVGDHTSKRCGRHCQQRQEVEQRDAVATLERQVRQIDIHSC